MLSIIIPVKNEPDLDSLLIKVHKVAESTSDQYEVLIVQGDREKEFHPYEEHPNQKTIWTYADSLDRSILNGFSHSRGERILVMDADGSHPPKKIPELYKALDKYDMVVGSRFVVESQFESLKFREFITLVCSYFAWFAGSNLNDPMSGFFAIRREILDKIQFKPLTWKTCLEIELKANPKVLEIPICFAGRNDGSSKTTLKTGLKLLSELAFIGVTGKL